MERDIPTDWGIYRVRYTQSGIYMEWDTYGEGYIRSGIRSGIHTYLDTHTERDIDGVEYTHGMG